MAVPDVRLEQMFPSLSPEEIDRLRRFGTTRRYAAGELLFTAGDVNSAMFVLISGSVGLSARDGLGHVLDIIESGPAAFWRRRACSPASLASRMLGPTATPRRSSSPATVSGPC